MIEIKHLKVLLLCKMMWQICLTDANVAQFDWMLCVYLAC
jgi:hypothetical protein